MDVIQSARTNGTNVTGTYSFVESPWSLFTFNSPFSYNSQVQVEN